MREIIVDTETTGIEPGDGHRLVEIGCIVVHNFVPTGETFHRYLNPERDVPPESVAVHGLTAERLQKEPVFSQIFVEFLEFIGDDPLVIHNAAFDMKFINAELKSVGHQGLSHSRVKDTLALARQKYPGSPASLDALCRRFAIDLAERDLHGALLDAQLLAQVYLEMMGGRQHGLGLAKLESAMDLISGKASRQRQPRTPRPHSATNEELSAHAEMIFKLISPIWKSLNS